MWNRRIAHQQAIVANYRVRSRQWVALVLDIAYLRRVSLGNLAGVYRSVTATMQLCCLLAVL